MYSYIIVRAKSQEEALCLNKIIKKKSTIFNNYLLLESDDIELFESVKNMCGTDKVYYARSFSSTKDLATYIESNAKSKPINFIFEEGSQEDLYSLIDEYLRISKKGHISEVEPKEVFKILKINGLYHLVQYEVEGVGGFCNHRGKFSVFIDGNYESYSLAYRFLSNGIDITAIIPFNGNKTLFRNMILPIYLFSKRCQNRTVDLLICDLRRSNVNNEIKTFSEPIFVAGGKIFKDMLVSIPLELLYDIKLPEKIKVTKTEFSPLDILKCAIDNKTSFYNIKNSSFNQILDEFFKKMDSNKNQNLE